MEPGVRAAQNASTQHGRAPSAVAPDLRQAYARAREIVAGSSRKRGEGHHVVWSSGSEERRAFLSADGSYAIAGRHTACGLRLGDDPFVALRHCLLRSIALSGGRMGLRVLDLHTGSGLSLVDGSRPLSLVAEGPLAFAIGSYALVALPAGHSARAAAAPAPREPEEAPRGASPYRDNARPAAAGAEITLLPAPIVLGRDTSTGGRSPAARPTYELGLRRAAHAAAVLLSDADLTRGVLVGRSEKCHDERLRRVTDVNTSRVHLVLLRENGAIMAYDAASTQGTYARGSRIGTVALADAGSRLRLGRGPSAVEVLFRRV